MVNRNLPKYGKLKIKEYGILASYWGGILNLVCTKKSIVIHSNTSKDAVEYSIDTGNIQQEVLLLIL